MAVVSGGGILGIGNKLVAVPYDHLRLDQGKTKTSIRSIQTLRDLGAKCRITPISRPAISHHLRRGAYQKTSVWNGNYPSLQTVHGSKTRS
jgi:hypothetical protein